MPTSGWILKAVTEDGTDYVRFKVMQPAPDQSYENWDLTADRAEAYRFPTKEAAETHNAYWSIYEIERAGQGEPAQTGPHPRISLGARPPWRGSDN